MSIRYLSNKVKNILKYDISIANLGILMNNINYEDVKDYVRYNENTYQRIQLLNNGKRLIYLLCWYPNQTSLIHDHPEDGCIFKVLKGQLDETIYEVDKTETNPLSVNSYAYRNGNKVLHKVVNGNEYSVTLHVYPVGYTPKYYPAPDSGT